MRIFSHNIKRLRDLRRNIGVCVLLLTFSGIVFASAEARAQAVPTRVQTLQLIKPNMPEPEQPLLKETKQEVRKMEKKIEVQYFKKKDLIPRRTQVPTPLYK